ncbi:MAG: response regulator [Phycisphaerales bacterium]
MNIAAPLRILCVDDNLMVAEALGRRIAREPDMIWCGVITETDPIYNCLIELQPNIVLMDIDMPMTDTFAIVARLAEFAPHVRVLMFSGHVIPAYIDRAFDCGAWGYLSKNDDVAKLLDAIRRAARGEIAVSEEVEIVQRHTLHRNL